MTANFFFAAGVGRLGKGALGQKGEKAMGKVIQGFIKVI